MFKLFTFIEIKTKLKLHKNVCKNHDYCYTEIPGKNKSILKYIHRKI